MESLSPLVRNTSVRRLSLELVQKFTTNLLTSPINNKIRSGRRASDACFESPIQKSSCSPRRTSISAQGQGQNSPVTTPFPFNLSPFRGQSSKSPFFLDLPDDGESHPEKKRPRKLSNVTCQVIPPTPKRRASLSFFPPEGFTPRRLNFSPDKENEERSKRTANNSSGRRSSTTFCSGTEVGPELISAATRFCSELELKPQEILGKGSFGTVVAANYKGTEIAVKVLRQLKSEEHLAGELNGLRLPPHPHIVSVLDVLRIPPDHRAFILLERMEPGNLLSFINDSGQGSYYDILGLSSVVDISSQIAAALSFCHSYGILHLDVKPQNILLLHQHHPKGDDGLIVKLSDFGNSRSVSDLRKTNNFNKLDGTVGYKAPELFKGEKPTEKCDVYSLGVTMWQLLTREQPYLGETEHSVIYKVVAQDLRPKAVCSFHPPKKMDNLEFQFVTMYETAWNGDPDRRQSMSQLYEQLCQLRNHFGKRTSFHQLSPLQSNLLNTRKTKQLISNY